ncbi:MAG: J domain-containing protein, partial [Candidatus Adiutrix sp.]
MTLGKRNPYAVLGVDEKASLGDIRRAYMALAVKYHPDRNPNDPTAEERFKDVTQAYAIICDPLAKAAYERGQRAQKKAQPQPSATSKTHPKSGTQAKKPFEGFSTAQNSQKTNGGGKQSKQSQEAQSKTFDNGFEEAFGNFFQSEKGRETLRDLEKELGKAGLHFNTADFIKWFKGKQKASPPRQRESFLSNLIETVTGRQRKAKQLAAEYDLNYNLGVSLSAAQAGTTVEISHQPDDNAPPKRLSVYINPKTISGSRLRLSGQGRLKPDNSRG